MDMKITRGTTPTLNFVLPFNTHDIGDLYFTFMQNGEIIFEKKKNDCILEDIDTSTENGVITDENWGDSFPSNDADVNIDELENFEEEEEEEEEEYYCTCSIHLTQQDTLGFHFWPAAEKNIAYCQFRIVDLNEEAYASDPLNFRIYGIFKDGEIQRK